MPDSIAAMERFWLFHDAACTLPLDIGFDAIPILCVLLDAAHRQVSGVAVSEVACRVRIRENTVRNRLRKLQSTQAVIIVSKVGRTEMFALTEATQKALERCLHVLTGNV